MRPDNGKVVSIEVFKSDSSEITEKDEIFYELLTEICKRATDNLRIKEHTSVLVVIADCFSREVISRIELAKQNRMPILIIHQKAERIPQFLENREVKKKKNKRKNKKTKKENGIWDIPYENKQDVLEFLEEAILSLLSPSGRRYVVRSKMPVECDV